MLLVFYFIVRAFFFIMAAALSLGLCGPVRRVGIGLDDDGRPHRGRRGEQLVWESPDVDGLVEFLVRDKGFKCVSPYSPLISGPGLTIVIVIVFRLSCIAVRFALPIFVCSAAMLPGFGP